MRISSDSYSGVASKDIRSFSSTNSRETTMDQRIKMLSTPSTPAENNLNFGFRDLIDIINPLQHIPIVSSLYRKITGDEIGSVARVSGGAIFGGAIGAFFGAVESAFKVMTGKDMGEHAIAFANYDKKATEKQINDDILLASNTKEPLYTKNIIEENSLNTNKANATEDTFIPLKTADNIIPFKEPPPYFNIERKKSDPFFDIDVKKQLDTGYIPQTINLNIGENTLKASQVSHIKKNNALNDASALNKPINANISGDNAFWATLLNREI